MKSGFRIPGTPPGGERVKELERKMDFLRRKASGTASEVESLGTVG
jgi:hypothetical protein